MSHHHDVATYRWRLGPADGEAVAAGSDVLFVKYGRITEAFVFVDAPA